MLKIKRAANFWDRLRSYKVVLDGKVVGEIRHDQELQLDAPPGKHQLYMKIDWCRSNIVEFESSGELDEFECGNSMEGLRVWLTMVYVTALRNSYLWLSRAASSRAQN